MKINDKVKIKDLYSIKQPDKSHYSSEEMKMLSGKTATIISISDSYDFGIEYYLDIDNGKWIWSDYMLEPINLNMTLEEKIILCKLITSSTFFSYNGKIKLRDLWDTLYNDNTHNPFNQQNKMRFTNKFFPMFLKAWREENDKLVQYIESYSDYDEKHPSINIMKKYYG